MDEENREPKPLRLDGTGEVRSREAFTPANETTGVQKCQRADCTLQQGYTNKCLASDTRVGFRKITRAPRQRRSLAPSPSPPAPIPYPTPFDQPPVTPLLLHCGTLLR